MKGLTLDHIAAAVGGKLHTYGDVNPQATATCVVTDSRKAEAGGVFIATRGARVDGHSFIPKMWELGVLCVICEEDLETSEYIPDGVKGNYIVVEDSFKALKALAIYYRNICSAVYVGITGSVGKTSTKEMVASVLSRKFRTRKTIGNFNNEIGVPLTLLTVQDEDEVAVVEMGISDFGEMSRLTAMARPDHCIITNIGPCHLEFLHDLDGVLKAKTEIFEGRNNEGAIILNGNDEKLRTVRDVDGTKPIFVGISKAELKSGKAPAGVDSAELQSKASADDCGASENAIENDIYANILENKGLEGTLCRICTLAGNFEVLVPLPGIHHVDNALVATAIGLHLGMSLHEIQEGIAEVKPLSGRSNLIRAEKYLLVDDCYNANPKAMRSALDLITLALGRKVAILGDMFELGENTNEMHASVGEYAVGRADVLICCGALSKHMYDAAAGKMENVYYFATRDEMMQGLTDLLREGDNIIIKASHGMGFDAVLEELSTVCK